MHFKSNTTKKLCVFASLIIWKNMRQRPIFKIFQKRFRLWRIVLFDYFFWHNSLKFPSKSHQLYLQKAHLSRPTVILRVSLSHVVDISLAISANRQCQEDNNRQWEAVICHRVTGLQCPGKCCRNADVAEHSSNIIHQRT